MIGPAVNVASRLESLSKEHGVQLVASTALAKLAEIPPGAFPEIEVTVRGTTEPVSVLLIKTGGELARYLAEQPARSAA